MKIIVAVAVAVMLVAGCSSTTNGSASHEKTAVTSRATATRPEAATSVSTAASPAPDLAEQLLTVADLPTGWAVDNSSNPDAKAPDCLKRAKSATDTPRRARADFVKGSDLPTLSDSIGYYGSKSVAKQRFDGASAVLTSCKDVSFDSDGTHVTGSIGAMSFPRFGEQSAAWQISLNADGDSIGGMEVLIQKGAELEVLGFLDFAPSTQELEDFCRAAVAKLP